jgi:hypothetical protein
MSTCPLPVSLLAVAEVFVNALAKNEPPPPAPFWLFSPSPPPPPE